MSDPERGERASHALYLVAARAQFLRRVLAEDWGSPEANERFRAHAFQALFDALDALELAEPGITFELARAQERTIEAWRDEGDPG